MHTIREGLFRRVMDLIITPFGTSGKEIVDNQVERMFGKLRSGAKCRFPKINFSRGITNLTRVTAKERVGIAFRIGELLLRLGHFEAR